ncbi:AMP-binding protein [Streptomyces sp. SCUT-3]|uniref:class I adenylate-forming enzyme family protein n=1 Tax=Streptomyces sp. SCUT-3 TaxID=2684469 RepID=UPI0015FA70D1|nr:AMP-binding protein [Streptomyces sp. SCUT-3]QMV24089.1 AMP-binding protein [Streptomyces sp. SCUT-3]
MSWYRSKPWLGQYDDALRAEPAPPPSVLHGFRASAAETPERTALAYFDARLSYRETDELSDGLAAHLAARGFRPGDRLAIVLQNVPQFVVALLGAWKAGGVVVPVNPMYRERELAHVLHDAEAAAVLCHEGAWHDFVRETVVGSPVRICLIANEHDLQTRNDPRVLPAAGGPAAEGADDVLAAARAALAQGLPVPAAAGPGPGATALISYTSGTSGTPKGATNTHGNLAFNAEGQRRLAGLPGEGTVFVLAPLFHITGMVCQLASALCNRLTLAMAHRFEPGVVLDAFAEHRPVFTVGPSTAYMALMAHPLMDRERFSSFTALYSGGAPLPPAVVERFREASGQYLHNGYGLTETSAPCVVVPRGREAPVEPASGTLSIGVPVPGAVVRILDEKGAELPPGEAGEIAVSGPMVVPGYWRRPEESAAALPGGELLTGDVGLMDADGWVYVVDRKKDMINASGFKVWPREVEDVLYTHPAVREAAVVGIPDEYRGETVKAFVSLRPGKGAEPGELVAYCKERLAAYKYPRAVEIVEELPKTTSGKILRRELR